MLGYHRRRRRLWPIALLAHEAPDGASVDAGGTFPPLSFNTNGALNMPNQFRRYVRINGKSFAQYSNGRIVPDTSTPFIVVESLPIKPWEVTFYTVQFNGGELFGIYNNKANADIIAQHLNDYNDARNNELNALELLGVTILTCDDRGELLEIRNDAKVAGIVHTGAYYRLLRVL